MVQLIYVITAQPASAQPSSQPNLKRTHGFYFTAEFGQKTLYGCIRCKVGYCVRLTLLGQAIFTLAAGVSLLTAAIVTVNSIS